MNEKGDISLSFGMIFSIILIIAIVGISFYVINYFLGIKECTDVALFFDEFQDKVDDIWVSESARDVYVGRVPGGIDSVCVGNLSVRGSGVEYRAFARFRSTDENVFLYPIGAACDVSRVNIAHLEDREFSCFQVEKGEVRINLEKGSFDTLVKVNG